MHRIYRITARGPKQIYYKLVKRCKKICANKIKDCNCNEAEKRAIKLNGIKIFS